MVGEPTWLSEHQAGHPGQQGIPAGYDSASWAYRNMLAQDKEHSPRGNRNSTQTLAASGSVNPLSQIVLVTATATATLETAVAADRRWHIFINTGSGTMTIACTGSETISGASSFSTSTPYAVVEVWSDGTNWHVMGSRTTLGLDNLLVPLMSWGGYKFDGSANYLDGNALTGIADGKKGTLCLIVRFANAASAAERIIRSAGNSFGVFRTATGEITVSAMNSGASTILSQTTNTTPCAAAGTYVILISFDLATGSSFRIYVNDVAAGVTSTTFTNDTIDYTVSEWAIGAAADGSNKMTGDGYLVWFDPTTNLEFNTESVRRKFINVDSKPVWLGYQGELPTGTQPILFLGYSNYRNWPINRGSAVSTTFTENGTPAAVTTTLNGQAFPRRTIVENVQVIESDYQITAGHNGHSVGPITTPAGVTVTTPTGSVWEVT